ncbi:DksA/TraR family C4-type zinc finger protein [uncultured Algimonas sp.]|uniref:DksA/TraR family C4-type zinc finger protein n=1 Tax=uncultured Algimonas sp. TaxID=1547920 RepID=UPI00344C4856
MAGGWSKDGAIQEQIDDSVKDAVRHAAARLPRGESARLCVECADPIPEARREALPGVKTCVPCQTERDGTTTLSPYNRRGSKGSQMR